MVEVVIKLQGMEEMIEAVRMLAAAIQGEKAPARQLDGAADQPPQTTQQPVTPAPANAAAPSYNWTPAPQYTNAPVPSAQLQPPVASTPVPTTAAPQPAQAAPTVPTQVPTTATPQQYSFDQLAVAMSNLCANMGKQADVHALLNQFGVNALFDLPKERYGEFATALRGIGGVI